MIENNKILIIDDDPGIRETYHNILFPTPKDDVLAKGASLFNEAPAQKSRFNFKKYELTMVERGEEGVREVEKSIVQDAPFAVAFIDMKMPGYDGALTSKLIWEIDPRIKIVIVTAYSEDTPDDIINATGRDDMFYLRKPFNTEEIRQFARALTKKWNLETEREYLSAQLADMNKNLEKKVKEQTAILVQTEKMASLGVLVAGVAHEINNPVAFIHGNLSSLKKYHARIIDLLLKYREVETHFATGRTDRIAPLLEEIGRFKKNNKIDFILEDISDLTEESLQGTARIRDIVKNLKTFVRKDQEELSYVDINETLDSALNIISNELQHRVKVVRNYNELPEVKCFSQKISQVFVNLLVNAAQAIESQGAIQITTSQIKEGRRAEDSKVKITISDNGRGIASENLLKIYDPFFTTKPVGKGTGLGLSISYDIIKAHGGEIKVDSDVNAGTTVTVILPLEAKI